MIVVEGPDGAGKSTLVRHICKKFHLKEGTRLTANRDEIWKTTRLDTFGAINDEFLGESRPRVWDRLGVWSDPIYSKFSIPERKCAFTMHEVATVNEMFRMMEWLLIFCLPPKLDVINNVAETHQMKGVSEHIDGIYEAYANLQVMSQYAVLYNYRFEGALAIIDDEVARYLDRRQERISAIGS